MLLKVKTLSHGTEASRPKCIPALLFHDMLKLASSPDVISFALGFPCTDLLPSRELAVAAGEVLATDGESLQYQHPSQTGLTEIIRSVMSLRGVTCECNNIFVTAGAQQALDMISRLLMLQHSTAIEERFAYPGFHQCIEPFRPCVIRTHSAVHTGIDVERFKTTLGHHPDAALFYFMADGHNPLGISLSERQRYQMAGIVRQYPLSVVEDDPYGLLQYEPNTLPPVHALAADRVLYVGSFSKILGPGLRIGWVVAPSEFISRLAVIKEASDLNTATLTQKIACRYFEKYSFEEHLARLRAGYRMKRDAMQESLQRHLPEGCTWSVPSAGVFFWIDLPERVDADAVLACALKQFQVAFMPASVFSGATCRNGMRLCFSRSPIRVIEEGVARIGATLKLFM